MGNSSQSYGASPAIGDHTPDTGKRARQTGRYSICLPRRDGWL